MKIVATGYMVRYPLAGMMLAFLHYVLGLQRMGHEVIWVEESGWDDSCYDPQTGLHGSDPTAGIQAVQDMVLRFGFRLPVCYVDRQSGAVAGMSRQQLLAHLSSADLLLNIGGTCALPEFERCRRKVLIDMDPMFTQAGRFAVDDLPEYDAYFTYGTNIGKPECSIPEAGVRWIATVPPVVTDLWVDWADTPPSGGSTMTTVCNWSAYGGIDYEGVHYGQKDEEFMRLLDLPKRSSETLELAISGADEATRSCLTDAGWRLREAEAVTADFDAYAGYIGDSRGEFSVAKNAYVKTASGWFSDRSVCYLAAGRPVVLQDTGTAHMLSGDVGFLVFSTVEQAVERLESLRSDYPRHARAAREIAADIFGHEFVLQRLIDQSFASVIDDEPDQVPPGHGIGA